MRISLVNILWIKYSESIEKVYNLRVLTPALHGNFTAMLCKIFALFVLPT